MVMVEGIDPIAPLRWSTVTAEQRLHRRRHIWLICPEYRAVEQHWQLGMVGHPSAPFQLEDLGSDAANHGVPVTLQSDVARRIPSIQEGCSVPIVGHNPIIERVEATRLRT
jgi:hypothetical protein